MAFKKKYQNWYLAKLWRHYDLIDKREVRAIIQGFGKRTYANSFYSKLVRVIYDETAEKEKPERCGKYRATYLVALYEDQLLVRRVEKHISQISKDEILEFKKDVEKEIRAKTVFVADNRFKRMRFDPKEFKTFKRIEHNKIHRVFSTLQKLHYNGKPYSKALWRQTANSHNLKVKFL